MPCGLLQFAFLTTNVYLKMYVMDFHTIIDILNELWHVVPEHVKIREVKRLNAEFLNGKRNNKTSRG